MQKEIFEQPQAIRDTLESRITNDSVIPSAFGHKAEEIFKSKFKQFKLLHVELHIMLDLLQNIGLKILLKFHVILKLRVSIVIALFFKIILFL